MFNDFWNVCAVSDWNKTGGYEYSFCLRTKNGAVGTAIKNIVELQHCWKEFG